jgi:Fic family protein
VKRGRPTRAALHERLELEIGELRTRLGGLPRPEEAEGIWTDIWYQEAHNSTAIEGNTLVLKQVETLLKTGHAAGEKELREYLEVTGYGAAAQWVYGQALSSEEWSSGELLSLTEVRHIHQLALGPVWQVSPHPDASEAESPGNWRRHDIQPFGRGMKPPAFTEVQSLMTDWVNGVRQVAADEAPIAVALAKRHAEFERVHPFIDGNGRAGRLLTNLILVRLGYPPAIIRKERRQQYLDALDRADQGDPEPLGEILARAILDNLNRFVLPAIAGPVKLVPLQALATPVLRVTALRVAALRGRLRAIRRPDGAWLSSKQWVDDYAARRYQRGAG